MKKNLCKTLVITVVMLMLCTTAFAAELTADPKVGDVTVQVTGLQTGDECTLLVVEAGTALADVATNVDKIYYVDQVTSENGVATFSLTVESGMKVDIYSGYTSMGESKPLELLASADVGDETIVFGDADGDGYVGFMDAILVLDYEAGLVLDENIDLKASDVDGDNYVGFMDAILILDYEAGLVESFPAENN